MTNFLTNFCASLVTDAMVGGRDLHMKLFKSSALKISYLICKRWSLVFFLDTDISEKILM